MNIPTRLKQLRIAKGLTAVQFCKLNKIPYKRYQSYENGTMPPLKTLVRFRDFYGFQSIDELIGSKPPPQSIESAFQMAPDNIKEAVKLLLSVDC